MTAAKSLCVIITSQERKFLNRIRQYILFIKHQTDICKSSREVSITQRTSRSTNTPIHWVWVPSTISLMSSQYYIKTVCKKTFVRGSFQRNRQCKLIVITIVVFHFVWLCALNTIFNTKLEGNCRTSSTTTVSLFIVAHNYTLNGQSLSSLKHRTKHHISIYSKFNYACTWIFVPNNLNFHCMDAVIILLTI